jgi:hypothetical protein
MADLAKQLKQLQDAQRLRELAQQYGYSQQDINTLRQALPQMAGQAMGQLPPAQMPQYVPPAAMPTIPQGMTPDDVNAMMNTMRQAAPPQGTSQMSPYMQNLTNPGQTMQQNYIDPAIIEQLYYRGLLSR